MARALGEVLADFDTERKRLAGAPLLQKIDRAERCMDLMREALATLPPELGVMSTLTILRRLDKLEEQSRNLHGHQAIYGTRLGRLEEVLDGLGGDGIVM